MIACAIGSKGEARTLGLRAPSGPYIQEVKYMCWVQLSSLVRPKRHGTACAIVPKGEARTLRSRAPWVAKAKLGHSDRVHHWFLILTKLNTWVGFNYHPWLGPKDREPRAPSVPKVKLGHSVCVRHWVLIFRKLYTWVGFNYPFWLGPKDTEMRATSVPKVKLGHSDRMCHRFQRRS